MQVVRHQYVGVEVDAETAGAVSQMHQERQIVVLVEEHSLGASAALNQMMWLTRNNQAGQTSHGGSGGR
jgi:hypothetical protein